jgi:integrase
VDRVGAISPMHVREYMEIRGKPLRSELIEKSLTLKNFQLRVGMGLHRASKPMPRGEGVQRNGRDRYITDEEFLKVKEHAHFTVIDAIDLARLTGQRTADVLKLKRSDIRDGALWMVQKKTGKRLGIEIIGELSEVITRINERPRQAISVFLIQDENGQRLTQGVLRSRFYKARSLSKVSFQFRDIRGKAPTDTGNLAHSQKLLGHKNRDMTEHYVKARMGERVKPLR